MVKSESQHCLRADDLSARTVTGDSPERRPEWAPHVLGRLDHILYTLFPPSVAGPSLQPGGTGHSAATTHRPKPSFATVFPVKVWQLLQRWRPVARRPSHTSPYVLLLLRVAPRDAMPKTHICIYLSRAFLPCWYAIRSTPRLTVFHCRIGTNHRLSSREAIGQLDHTVSHFFVSSSKPNYALLSNSSELVRAGSLMSLRNNGALQRI